MYTQIGPRWGQPHSSVFIVTYALKLRVSRKNRIVDAAATDDTIENHVFMLYDIVSFYHINCVFSVVSQVLPSAGRYDI